MRIFLHIPKTGGRSLYEWLQRHAAGRKWAYLDEDDGVREMAERARGATLIMGHIPFGVHCRHGLVPAGEAPPRYCTILRDPVERVIGGRMRRNNFLPLRNEIIDRFQRLV